MGEIVGAIAGLAGGLIQNAGAGKAAKQALTGFNYLTNSPQVQGYVNQGSQAIAGQGNTEGSIAGLLGQGPNSAANQAAFNNYLGSTGYQFQLGQGTQAINSNAASRGLLQSGANAKALEGYGQNLASTTFNNYLSQLGGLGALQGQTAGIGANVIGGIGQAGTAGGAGAANATLNGANALGNSIAGFGGAVGNFLG